MNGFEGHINAANIVPDFLRDRVIGGKYFVNNCILLNKICYTFNRAYPT